MLQPSNTCDYPFVTGWGVIQLNLHELNISNTHNQNPWFFVHAKWTNRNCDKAPFLTYHGVRNGSDVPMFSQALLWKFVFLWEFLIPGMRADKNRATTPNALKMGRGFSVRKHVATRTGFICRNSWQVASHSPKFGDWNQVWWTYLQFPLLSGCTVRGCIVSFAKHPKIGPLGGQWGKDIELTWVGTWPCLVDWFSTNVSILNFLTWLIGNCQIQKLHTCCCKLFFSHFLFFFLPDKLKSEIIGHFWPWNWKR